MLDKVYYNNSLKEWLIALSIVVGTAIICKLISIISRLILKKIAKKAKPESKFDNKMVIEKIKTPLLLILMLLSFWIAAVEILTFSQKVEENIIKSFIILFSLNITWIISRFFVGFLDRYINSPKHKNTEYQRIMPLLKRTISILIWTTGSIMALNNIGVSISAMLGTLGIGGLAIALASQDTIKNIIGGITVISDSPFKIGDRIKFDTVDGFVEDIGLRSTKIRTLDKRIIAIPNSQIVDAAIENVSGEVGRRIVINIGISYDTTPEKLRKAIEILNNTPNNVKNIDNKDISATFQNFADNSLTLTFIYFIKKTSPDIMNSISDVNFYILDNFKNNEIKFAYPHKILIND